MESPEAAERATKGVSQPCMYWNSDRRRDAITFTIQSFFLPEAFVIRDEQSDEKKAGWLSMFFPSLVELSLRSVDPAVERCLG